MTMNNVVKMRQFTRLLKSFSDIIHSKTVNQLSRSHIQDFTRRRVMTFDMVVFYLIFRNRKNTDADLIKFFSSLDILEKRITKQAMHKNIRKLNSNVFRYLFQQFALLFYSSGLNLNYHDYILLGEDGTFLEIPYDIYNINFFGIWENQHVHDMFDIKKIVSKSSGLYDITNGLFVDFTLKQATYSELPLAFEHLYRTRRFYKDKKVIYLADRYYGSAELISFLDYLGYNYCIRGKSYFYKKQISQMKSNDEFITVTIDDKWLKRFSFSPEATEYRIKQPKLKIRVVKRNYIFFDKYGKKHIQEMTYFTNLSKDEFEKREIEELYSKRWDIEVAYKILKTQLELERNVSRNVEVIQSCIYAKILFFNMTGILRKNINHDLMNHSKHIKKPAEKDNSVVFDFRYWSVNITQLINCFMDNNILKAIIERNKKDIIKKIYQILKACEKLKVPIRPNRHNERWGRIVPSGYYYRFTLDGRNFPKVKTIKGVMRTTKP